MPRFTVIALLRRLSLFFFKLLMGLFCLMVVGLEVMALPQSPRSRTWVPNGFVWTMAEGDDGTIYAGGGFNHVGSYVHAGIPLLTTADNAAPDYVEVYGGTITGVISDGAGGWYIGGDFNTVGSVPRSCLAHILPNGSVDPDWAPDPNYEVSELLIDDDLLYVAGRFTTIDGQSRSRIAAINIDPDSDDYGEVTAWNPGANGAVRSMVKIGNTVYVGGSISVLGGQNRTNIGAVDATTGLATAWSPISNSTLIYDMEVSADQTLIYASGGFTAIGGQNRNRVAALKVSDGTATSFNPNVSSTVLDMLLQDGVLYMIGSFTTVGGVARNRMAAVDADPLSSDYGDPLSLNPNLNNTGYGLAINGSTLYIAGHFTTVGSESRSRIAAVNLSDGSLNSWNPGANANVKGNIYAIALNHDATQAYVGGFFSSADGVVRNNAYAFDSATGQPTSWNPDINSSVNTLIVDGSTIYLGGIFTSVGGQTRNRLAAVHSSSAALDSWNPNASSSVFALTKSGTTVYAGGGFTTVGGNTRNRLAAIDTDPQSVNYGQVTAFNPDMSSNVRKLLMSGTTLYVGGDFTTTAAGATTRNRLAALDADPTSVNFGKATAWNPNLGGLVRDMLLSGTTLYTCGDFTTTAGGVTTRNRLAAIDTGTGTATAWNPNLDGPCYGLALNGTTLYLSGDFDNIGGVNRRYMLGAVDTSTGAATSWTPDVNEVDNLLVADVLFTDGRLYASGSLKETGANARIELLQFGPAEIQFSPATASGSESSATVTLPVSTVSADIDNIITANYTVTGGSAANGSDYVLASGSVSIAAGSSSPASPITFTVSEDVLDESDETITFALSSPSTFAELGEDYSYTYTITDNDASPTVSFSSASQTVMEDAGSAGITAALSEVSGRDVVLSLSLSGAATSGNDYSGAPNSITIPAGSLSTTATFTLIEDEADETDETLILSFVDAVTATLGSITSHLLTILDNDVAASGDDLSIQAKAGSDQSIMPGGSFILDGTTSTGTSLSYSWAIVSGSGTLSASTISTPTFTAGTEAGNVTVSLTVTDSWSRSSSDTLVIHVLRNDQVEKTLMEDPLVASCGQGDSPLLLTQKYEGQLTTGSVTITLPSDHIDNYQATCNSQGRLALSLPATGEEDLGQIILFNDSLSSMSGVIDLTLLDDYALSKKKPGVRFAILPVDSFLILESNTAADGFGDFISWGDINNDGTQEILVYAPQGGDHGVVYAFNEDGDSVAAFEGTEDYPAGFVLATSFLSDHDLFFAPPNPALNSDLRYQDSLTDAQRASFTFLLESMSDISGSLTLGSGNVDGRYGNEGSYQSSAFGDLNGDGNMDLALGNNVGLVEIYFGPSDGSDLPDVLVQGPEDSSRFAQMIGLGDVTGDGIDDLVIGSPEGGSQGQGVLMVLNGMSVWPAEINLSTDGRVLQLAGEAGDYLGSDLLLADGDNDGIQEIYAVNRQEQVYQFVLAIAEEEGGAAQDTSSGGGGCSLKRLPADAFPQSSLVILLSLGSVFTMIRIRKKSTAFEIKS